MPETQKGQQCCGTPRPLYPPKSPDILLAGILVKVNAFLQKLGILTDIQFDYLTPVIVSDDFRANICN